MVQHVQLQAEDRSPLYSSVAESSCSVDMMLPLTVITSPVQNKNKKLINSKVRFHIAPIFKEYSEGVPYTDGTEDSVTRQW